MTSTHQLCQTLVYVNDAEQPLTYKPPSDVVSDTCKIDITVGTRNLTKKVKNWQGLNGKNMEPFCKVLNEFNFTMENWNLQHNATRKFEVFPSFLGENPLSHWRRISVNERNVNGTNIASFESTMKKLIEQFARAT